MVRRREEGRGVQERTPGGDKNKEAFELPTKDELERRKVKWTEKREKKNKEVREAEGRGGKAKENFVQVILDI